MASDRDLVSIKNKKTGKKIKIKLIKSPYGFTKDQIGTVRALGLKRMNQVKEHINSSVIQGMIFKVKHLVKVIEN